MYTILYTLYTMPTEDKTKLEQCKVCNKNFVSIHLHHINGNRKDNRKSNLINVCPKCHNMVHKGIRNSYKNIQKYLAPDYLSYKKGLVKNNQIEVFTKIKELRLKWILGKFKKEIRSKKDLTLFR